MQDFDHQPYFGGFLMIVIVIVIPQKPILFKAPVVSTCNFRALEPSGSGHMPVLLFAQHSNDCLEFTVQDLPTVPVALVSQYHHS